MMKKNILKASLVAFVGVSAIANAQKTPDELRGRFGVNINEPRVTIDLNVASVNVETSRPEGIIIPSVTRKRAQDMGTNVPNATILYINDVTTGTQTLTTINVDGKGFYYFDGKTDFLEDGYRNATATDTWVKLNSGGGTSSAVPYQEIRGNVKTLNNVKNTSDVNYTIAANDFLIITNNNTNTTITFPDTSEAEKGRMIHLFNNNTVSGGLVLEGSRIGMTTTNQGRGRTFVSDGTQWVGIGL